MKKSTAMFAATVALLLAQSVGAQTASPTPAPAAAAAAPAAKETADSGKAVFYSDKFNGRKTFSGERFNNRNMVAAHRTLPMGTLVEVTNSKNKKTAVVRIIDRGPSQPDRIIDVSRAAATKLGFVRAGVTDVTIKVVGKGKANAAKPAAKSASKAK